MTTQPDKSPNSPTEPWSCCNGHPEFQNNQFKCKYCNTTYDDYLRNNPIPDYATHQLSYQQLTKQLEKSKQELLDLYSENDALNEILVSCNQKFTEQANQISYLQSENQQLTEQLEKNTQTSSGLYYQNDTLNQQNFRLNKDIQYQREQFEQELSRKSMRVEALMNTIIVNYFSLAMIIYDVFFVTDNAKTTLSDSLLGFSLYLLCTIIYIKYNW